MTPKPNRTGWRAVLIGVSQYADPNIGNIPAASNNVHDLKELLTVPVGAPFYSEDCITIVNPDTSQQVGKPLVNAGGQADDVLLVYYAGHGLVDQRGRLYLAVTGSDSAHPEWSSIPIATLRENLVAARARARVLILDCCFSGRAFEAMTAPDTVVNGQIDISGTYTIASSARDETSIAPEGARNTAFTDALLTAVASSTGLTLDQLYTNLEQILHRKGHPRPKRRSVDKTGSLRLFAPPDRQPRPGDGVIPFIIDPTATPDSTTEQIFANGQRSADQGDLTEAEKAWRTAASHGHSSAMNNLANLAYSRGKLREAHQLYLDAAQRGNTAAMVNLADLLHRAHENTDAKFWWQRAAEAGDTDAMYALACMLDKSHRFDEALIWYRNAAEAGHTDAMHNLAIRLRYRGQLAEATTWWHNAGHERQQRASEQLRRPTLHRESH